MTGPCMRCFLFHAPQYKKHRCALINCQTPKSVGDGPRVTHVFRYGYKPPACTRALKGLSRQPFRMTVWLTAHHCDRFGKHSGMHTPTVWSHTRTWCRTSQVGQTCVSDATQPPEEGELREGDGVQRVVLPLLLLLARVRVRVGVRARARARARARVRARVRVRVRVRVRLGLASSSASSPAPFGRASSCLTLTLTLKP